MIRLKLGKNYSEIHFQPVKMNKYLAKECKTIQDNCIYTAETHHIIASRNEKIAFWSQLAPAVIAALSGLLIVGQIIPVWWGWLTVISSVITAVANVLNPYKGYYDHLNAAKSFTILKQDARALCQTFSNGMNEKEFSAAVKDLHDRYNDIVRFTPPTDNKSFEEARKRVKAGIHEQD